jgi:hypothetical protein
VLRGARTTAQGEMNPLHAPNHTAIDQDLSMQSNADEVLPWNRVRGKNSDAQSNLLKYSNECF